MLYRIFGTKYDNAQRSQEPKEVLYLVLID